MALPLRLFTLACFAAAAAVTATGATSSKPNIIVFLADDLGYGDLGCYGHPVIKTPNLDAFARQGVRFTQCYAASGVCSPSRSAILTGRTPYRNGVFTWIPEGRDLYLRKSELALPRLLKAGGYATCHVGKWHLNSHFNQPSQPQSRSCSRASCRPAGSDATSGQRLERGPTLGIRRAKRGRRSHARRPLTAN